MDKMNICKIILLLCPVRIHCCKDFMKNTPPYAGLIYQ